MRTWSIRVQLIGPDGDIELEKDIGIELSEEQACNLYDDMSSGDETLNED